MPLVSKRRAPSRFRIPPRFGPIWILVQLVAGALIGVGLFDRLLMPLAVGRGGGEPVPALRGAALEEGRRKLEGAGLELGEIVEVVDEEIPEGRVIAQEPAAGSNVREGRRVRVLVSLGPPVRAVPELAGQTVRSATIALAQQDLRSGSVLSVPSASPEGLVIGSRPPRGGSPAREGKVDLLVSAGPRRFVYLMPDLRGMRLSEARSMIHGTGLRLILEGDEDRIDAEISRPDPSSRWIYEQSPPPGYPVRSGESIHVG